MASTAETAATQQQYLAQVAMTSAMTTAVASLAQTAPDPASPAFRTGMQALIEQLAQVAASIARDYYQQVRTDAGITAPIRITPIPAPPESMINAAIDYGLRATKTTDQSAADFAALVQQRIEAANQKILADAAREQVIAAVEGDEKAIGFRRVPRPGACYFCITMAIRTSTRAGLASEWVSSGGRAKSLRGRPLPGQGEIEHFGVYKSRTLASGQGSIQDFEGDNPAAFHDHCHCVVEPVFSAVEQLPEWLMGMKDLYDSTDGGLNGFRRALYARRNGEPGPEVPIAPAVPLRAASPQPQIAALLAGLDDAMRRGAA